MERSLCEILQGASTTGPPMYTSAMAAHSKPLSAPTCEQGAFKQPMPPGQSAPSVQAQSSQAQSSQSVQYSSAYGLQSYNTASGQPGGTPMPGGGHPQSYGLGGTIFAEHRNVEVKMEHYGMFCFVLHLNIIYACHQFLNNHRQNYPRRKY